MQTPLLPEEYVLLSSAASLSIGGRADLFPSLAEGLLTLTNERLVFEPTRRDGEAAPVILPLSKIGAVLAGWIKLFDLIPMYACLDILTTGGETIRLGVVRMDARKPREWVDVINSAQARLALPGTAPEVAKPFGDAKETEGQVAVPAGSIRDAKIPDASSAEDGIAWLIAAVPLVGAGVEYLAGARISALGPAVVFAGYLAVNTLLCFYDMRRLRSDGHESPDGWTAFIVPVYLWKRAKLLGRNQLITAAWIAAFVAAIFVTQLRDKDLLAESACPVVTKIIQQQLNGSAACRRVAITDDLGGGLYTGRALLDNGRELKITVENRGEEIYVQIPPQW